MCIRDRLYTAIAIGAARVYFGQWTNHPEVRVQYETTMVTALRYLDAHGLSLIHI